MLAYVCMYVCISFTRIPFHEFCNEFTDVRDCIVSGMSSVVTEMGARLSHKMKIKAYVCRCDI